MSGDREPALDETVLVPDSPLGALLVRVLMKHFQERCPPGQHKIPVDGAEAMFGTASLMYFVARQCAQSRGADSYRAELQQMIDHVAAIGASYEAYKAREAAAAKAPTHLN